MALRDIGLQAEQAGTAFRNIIVRLTQPRPAQDFLDALDTIGVRFEDLKALAQTGEYEEIFRRLGDAGLDAATAISLFGTEGFSAGANLSESISKVDALTESLIGAEGWAEQMRLIQEQGLPGAIAAFRSALESLQLELGSAGLTNWIAAAADALRGFVLWLRDASGWVKTTMAIVLASGPVLLGLAAFLKLVTFALSGLVPLLKLAAWANKTFGISAKLAALWNSNLILSLRLAAISAGQYVASLKIAGVATRVFRGVMLVTSGAARIMWLAITGPIGLVIAALVGVGLIILKFRRQIVDALMGVWNFVKDKWREIAGLLLLPILGPFALIATNAFGLRDKLMGVFSSIKDFFMGIWGTIVGIFRDHWAKILAVIFPPAGIPLLIAQEWDQIVGIVGGIWNRVYDTVKGWIEAIISFIKELPGRVVGILKDIPGMIADAIRDIPGLGAAIEVFTGIAGKVGKVFTGAAGGVAPGPLGRPVPAIIHGGEMVLPKGASSVLAQMLEGFRLGPAALPQAPHYYGQMYRSSVTNRTVNINMNEPIVIQTQATDAKGIAQELGEAIQDQIRNVAYDHDGPVER